MSDDSNPDSFSDNSLSSIESIFISEEHPKETNAKSKDSVEIDDVFQESVDIIGRFGRNITTNDSLCAEDFNDLPSVMAEFIEMKSRFDISQRVFNGIMDKINSVGDEKLNAEKILKVYEREISKRFENLDTENSEFCKEFENMLFNRKGKTHDDSEITTVAENVNAVDPITKLPLQDPVKNVKCGHSYERSTIMDLINKKDYVRCPIPGCITVTFLNKADLVPDVALKRYLNKK